MKKAKSCFGISLLICSLLLFLSLTGFAQDKKMEDGPVKFNYSSGKLSSEGTIRNGKPDGYWKTYFENGKLKSEGNRLEFKLDGIWKFYSETGITKAEIDYHQGKKDGTQKTYYEDGTLYSEENYKEDVKTGYTKMYFDSGGIQKTIPFKEGIEVGFGYEFSKDTLIISIIEYKNGFVVKEEKINRKDRSGAKQGLWREFYKNSADEANYIPGKVKTEGLYKDNKKQQRWTVYDGEGKFLRDELYINGELVTKEEDKDQPKLDIKKEYYSNGQVKSSGTYNTKGKQEGVFREYTEEGKVYDAKVYKAGRLMREGLLGEDGLEQGPWKEFYESGALRAEGKYENGKRVGMWKFYYENKNLEQEGNFVNGKADGTWKWYYPSHRLLREEVYKDGKENGLMKEYTDNDANTVDWNVLAEGLYESGKKQGVWTYRSDEIISTGAYSDGKEEGEWKQYFNNPGKKESEMKLSFIGSYSGGEENGVHQYFFSNGKPREVQTFRMGMRDGEWKRWDVDNNLILTTQYQDGKEMRFDGVKFSIEKDSGEGK